LAQRYFTVEIVEPLHQEPFLRNGFTCICWSVLHRFIYTRRILKNERGRVCIPATLGLWPCVYVPPLSQIGASGRTRTGTALRPRDFKSLVSAYFTTKAMVGRMGIKPTLGTNQVRTVYKAVGAFSYTTCPSNNLMMSKPFQVRAWSPLSSSRGK